jgi:hypothetical protein
MGKRSYWKEILLAGLVWMPLTGSLNAQMNMNPYFSTINYPLEKHSLMLMALQDFQSERYGNNFFTGMLMVEYGLTQHWTVGFMVEGQKIAGMPAIYGGMRFIYSPSA